MTLICPRVREEEEEDISETIVNRSCDNRTNEIMVCVSYVGGTVSIVNARATKSTYSMFRDIT